MRICGHDFHDNAVPGFERPGPCCILIVSVSDGKFYTILLLVTTYECNAEVGEFVEYACSRVECQVLARYDKER
jgi:hypothetical protein